MTVFKPTGKYYTTETIDVPDLPLCELQKTEEYRKWEHMYPSMYKFCTADVRCAEYENFEFNYCTAFLLLPVGPPHC